MNIPIMITFCTNNFGTFGHRIKTYQMENFLGGDKTLDSHHKHNKINIYQYFA